METPVYVARIAFEGIYETGRGWTSTEAFHAWHAYWKGLSDTWWHFAELRGVCGTAQYLVSTGGGTMIHPMGFEISYIRTGEYGGEGSKLCPPMDRLAELCMACAGKCGGMCRVHGPMEIDVNLPQEGR